MENKLEKNKYLNNSENRYLYKENKDNKEIIQTPIKDTNIENISSREKQSKIECRYYFLFTLITLILLLIFFKSINDYKNKKFKSNKHNRDYFPNLQDSFKKAKGFLDKCLKNILINNSKIIPSENPKVSAVIPFFNRQKTILRAIRSIQNQNLTDLEIILVNDFSLDETMSIIEQIQKEDKRIKVINNKKVMGTLYSRSIGALYSKGKYIFPLDSDDMLLDSDVYYTITNIADKGNYDLVGFRIIYSTGNNILKSKIGEFDYSNHYYNHTLFQPELGLYPIKLGNTLGEFYIIDILLYNKCIRTKIYKDALNKMGEEKYSRYMTHSEDLAAIIFLFNTAKSMRYVGKYGTLHIKTPMSDSLRYFSHRELNFCDLYLTDFAIDFTKDTFESRKLVVHLMVNLMNNKQIQKTFEEKEFCKLFKACMDKILNMKYISNEDKEEIRKRAINLNISNITLI